MRKGWLPMRVTRSTNFLPAATKLLHDVFAERKLLTRQRELRESLQSIIGATLIFLSRFNLIARLPKVSYISIFLRY